jgi:hypothetical protein
VVSEHYDATLAAVCRTRIKSSGVLASAPTVATAEVRSSSETPSAWRALTQSIATARPGGLARSSERADYTKAVASSTSPVAAPGTRLRTMSVARSTVG